MPDRSWSDVTVCFVSASGQNVFFEEFEQLLGRVAGEAGMKIARSVDMFPVPRDDTVFVVVPHEYLALTAPDAHPADAHLARTIALATEQPGTPWFELSRSLCERAAATVDINRVGCAELRRHGVDARYLPLAYCPEWDAWHGDERERPIDVLFLGAHTERRERVLAGLAPVLSRRRSKLLISDGSRPLQHGDPGVLTGRPKWELYAASKLLLNIHRSDLGYLEWHRTVPAIVNGAVVVTDHSYDIAPLRAGVDIVSVAPDSLPHVVDYLLDDADALDRIRRSAIARLREAMPLEAMVDVLREAVDRALTRRLPPFKGDPSPRPKARFGDGRLPGSWELAKPPDDLAAVRIALKRVMTTQREMQRQLQRLQPMPPWDETTHVGPRLRRVPEVSIVLTVHNYAHLVGDAIASVAASTHPSFELIVVDDASTDDSPTAIRHALELAPRVPATIERLSVNRGLPGARNRGVELSRGRFVFMLDADNSVYPAALTELAAALRADDGLTFAYPIIERFTADGPAGLVSWKPWQPEELRYGNFVDAMAMIRRSVLEEVGGYATHPALSGWEDFELWCRLADGGYRGLRVPNILCRYRSGRTSMITLTNIDTREAWSYLVDRYAFAR